MNKIKITIKKELRGIVRDKKSLMMMLLTPLMIPAFMILFSYVYDDMNQEDTQEGKKYTIGVNYTLDSIEQELAKEYSLETKKYRNKKELEEAYQHNKIDTYIIKKENTYTIYSNSKDSNSIENSSMAYAYLESYNSYLGHEYLANFPIDMEKVDSSIQIETKELKGTNELVNMILYMGIVFSMMAISLTAIYGVTDSIAGEKERGTLETLLTFPITSKELIMGKYLAITISCMITSIISTALVIGSLAISSKLFSLFKGVILYLNIPTILLVLVLMISYSFFISGLSIAIASFSKTYKEAQSSLTPVNFITMVPMIFNILEISLNKKIALIPIVSHTMLINELVTKEMNSKTILYLGIILISTFLYSFILVQIIGKLYKNEKVLFSN